ncbi:MAG: nitrilase family protein [Bacteroidales bacterium]|nr:nitrilase family protein [Bacteroidales bacterium]
MKIALLQGDLKWASPESNAQVFEEMILKACDCGNGCHTDLYVLPEMWSTGFATVPEGIAEEFDTTCRSLEWMKSMADRTDAAIAGSVAVHCSDGTYRNRFFFVKPGGGYVYYDKHHLFTYGGEHLRYTAGNERVTVEWRGVRFLLLVCYDLRFPMWARSREDYDAIIYVASWPTPRVEAWNALLKARAIENQCYVLGVNRVGTDPSCEYCGGTAFIDPYGAAELCPYGEVSVLPGQIDMDALNAFRQKFPVLSDRD